MKNIKLWDWVVLNQRLKTNVTYKNKMNTYCVKCENNAENIDPEISSTSNGKAMILSNHAICGSKKSRFIKNQEAKRLLSKLGIKTPLSKVPILGLILF